MFKMKTGKNRKGFSLVELVIVILIIAILAVAIFAGGSIVIKKAQVSQTVSDLHNFSVAVESTLNENPGVANIDDEADLADIVAALNANLPIDYQLTTEVTTSIDDSTAANLHVTVAADDNYAVWQSAKLDAWDNPYYVIVDFGERHGATQSDFYITVVSAGPNAKTEVGGLIESDDIFLLGQYTDGDVSAYTWNCAEHDGLMGGYDAADTTTSPSTEQALTDGNTTGVAVYVSQAPASDVISATAPVNY